MFHHYRTDAHPQTRSRPNTLRVEVSPRAVDTCAPQGQGVRGVKTMVKKVDGRQITPTRTIWKEVRRMMLRGVKNPLDLLACGAPVETV